MGWSAAPLVIEPVDLNALERAIAEALQAPETHIFLDTNILIWLFKPHASARDAFLAWLEEPSQAKRVHIPARVIHEFSRYRSDRKVLLGDRSTDKLLNQVNQFVDLASLIVGDAQAKKGSFADRAAYLDELKKIQDIAARIVKPMGNNKELPELEKLLIPKFNRFAMQNNIFRDMARLQKEYEARAEVRMPPGFEDVKKAKRNNNEDDGSDLNLAGANRFGDFIIWEEILEFCATRGGVKTIIILSHDQKKDWCYRPQKVKDVDGRDKSVDNIDYKLTVAHPMLVSEAQFRARVNQLFAVTVPQFARIGMRHSFVPHLGELARAVQVEASEGRHDNSTNENSNEDNDSSSAANQSGLSIPSGIAPQANIAAAGVTNFLANLPEVALADESYTSSSEGSPEMDEAIQGLKTINWYAQNPAASQGLSLIRASNSSLLQAFVFGRNLYQAACGTAIVPERIIADLPRELIGASDDLAGAVYAGVLCEVYIDKAGKVRGRPKSAQIQNVFRHQAEEKFQAAVLWIRTKLQDISDKYALLPDKNKPTRIFDVSGDAAGNLLGIAIGNLVLTVPYSHPNAEFPLPPIVSNNWLQKSLAAIYAIPAEQVELSPAGAFSLNNADKSLTAWGPYTTLSFPPV